MKGVSSIALSPDGRYLYSTSFNSDAVDVFRRNK
jgi:DNA-binding beta-propeller fold protein YncE